MVQKKKFWNSIAFRIITSVVVLLIIFSSLVGAIGYRQFTDSLLQQYSDSAFLVARISARIVNDDQIETFLKHGSKSQEYEDLHHRLSRICNASGSTFVYIIRPDTKDYNHITFIVSTANPDYGFQPFEFGYVRETTNDDYRAKYRALYEEGSTRELVIRDSGYISTDPHISAMVPIKDDNDQTIAIMVVQRQLDVLVQARWKYINQIIFVMLLLTIIFVIFMGLYLLHIYIRPVKMISDEAIRFAEENTLPVSKLSDEIIKKDEIGILADSVDQMEDRIDQYVKDLTVFTAEKERMNTELALATRIQDDMLPSTFPAFPDRTEFDIYASMDPARQVGGDFYNYFMIDDDHLCLLIADVSGKGIPAALFMMSSMITLTDIAQIKESPGNILRLVNEAICARNKEEMFVSVWLGVLQISTGKLTAANAGHEYPMLSDGNGRFEVIRDKHGLVIGAMENVKYSEYELQMVPGSRLFIYTDGLPEASDKDNQMFGMDRILETLNADPDASPGQTLDNIREAVDRFVQEAEQFDDLTMLCLEYKGI